MTGAPEETNTPNQPSSTTIYPKVEEASAAAAAAAPAPSEEEETKKWGAHVMGPPAVPTIHPDNQKAALWNAGDHHQPYLIYSPVDKPTANPLEPVIHMFNSWTSRAETLARNIWHNRK